MNIKYLLFIFFVYISWGQQKKADDIEKISELLYTEPVKANAIIDSFLQLRNLEDKDYGALFNLKGIYYVINFQNEQALTNYQKSLDFYIKMPKKQANIRINIAHVYRMKDNMEKANQELMLAYKIFNQYNDQIGMSEIYGEIGTNHYIIGEYYNAAKALIKAIELGKKGGKNYESIIIDKQRLANTYRKMRDYKFANQIYLECLEYYKNENSKSLAYYSTLLNYGQSLIYSQDYSNAKTILNEALNGFKSLDNRVELYYTLSRLAKIAQYEKNSDKAESLYHQAYLNVGHDNKSKRSSICIEYAEILIQQEKYTLANKVLEGLNEKDIYPELVDKFHEINARIKLAIGVDKNDVINDLLRSIKIKDSINDFEKENMTNNILAKYQTDLQLSNNKLLKEQNKRLRQKRLFLFIYLLVVIMAGIIILYLFRQKNKQYIEKNKLISKQIRQEQIINNTQKETLLLRERELTSLTLQVATFQDEINRIIKIIDKNNPQSSILKNNLNSILKKVDYWSLFTHKFSQIYPNFADKLSQMYPMLTKNEINFCALLKLNFSNKEIASMLQISHKSVISKKYIIRRKMNICEEDDFERTILSS